MLVAILETYVGVIGYGDDVTRITPTRHALITLLDIANEYSKELHVQFNPAKSKLVIVSHSHQDTPIKYIASNFEFTLYITTNVAF